MHLMRLLLCCVASGLVFFNTPAVASPKKFEVDRVEDSTVFFRTLEPGSQPPKPLKTDLYDLTYFGAIHSPNGDDGQSTPYFFFAGKPCKSCQHDKTLYAIRAESSDKSKIYSYTYPGKIIDPKTGSVLMESRAFIGRCLRDLREVYVVFQKEKVDRRKFLQTSVFVAEAHDASLNERLIERRLPALRETQAKVRAKSCREIEGRNRNMLLKPLDLTPRKSGDEDEAEEEDDNKSNDSDENSPTPSTEAPGAVPVDPNASTPTPKK